MAKKLVIVESPAKAKTINKFLGKDYQVEASFGHVRDLPKSRMGVDIENHFAPQYIIPVKARKRVTLLKKAAKGKKEIYLAPDPDREGEAISWHLAFLLKDEASEIKRVEFHEITKDAIKHAFEHPREINQRLVNAQQARRVLDRIVGYGISPLLWQKIRKGLSAGRVQSIALRFIVERELEIRKFIPQEYWSLLAKLSPQEKDKQAQTFTAKLERIGKEKAELKTQDQTLKIKKELEHLPFKVTTVEKKERTRKPQAPYTTSKLQQEAYNRLGFPAAKTMRFAQKLYEGVELGPEGSVGLITYMRTDSVRISEQAQKETRDYILKEYGKDFLPSTPPVYKSKKSAQEAHEAIRPTSAFRHPDSLRSFLDDDEFKLYDLIWRKLVASQMANAVDLVTSIDINAGSEYVFRASGTINLFPGFLNVFQDFSKAKKKKKINDAEGGSAEEEEDVEQKIPELKEGDVLTLRELLGNQHFTKPPARFNDASLVKALEEEGIGRPSTYAPTIMTLLSRDYAQRRGGALIPTETAEMVLKLLLEHFPTILNVEFTANMEEKLDEIEEGDTDWIQILEQFYKPFNGALEQAKILLKDMKPEIVETKESCEKCGKVMIIRWGRFGKFMACSGFPECKNAKPLPTGVACPQEGCGGYLVKRKSKRGSPFYGCSKYPQCTYLVNQLPKQDESSEQPEAAPNNHQPEKGS